MPNRWNKGGHMTAIFWCRLKTHLRPNLGSPSDLYPHSTPTLMIWVIVFLWLWLCIPLRARCGRVQLYVFIICVLVQRFQRKGSKRIPVTVCENIATSVVLQQGTNLSQLWTCFDCQNICHFLIWLADCCFRVFRLWVVPCTSCSVFLIPYKRALFRNRSRLLQGWFYKWLPYPLPGVTFHSSSHFKNRFTVMLFSFFFL